MIRIIRSETQDYVPPKFFEDEKSGKRFRIARGVPYKKMYYLDIDTIPKDFFTRIGKRTVILSNNLYKKARRLGYEFTA